MSDNFWLATTALSTAALALATVVLMAATIFVAWGVLKEVQKYRADSNFHAYSQLDNIYYDIQREIIHTPHLANPHGAKTEVERRQYDAFAFITWNFIEAIFDQCEKEATLHETWDVIAHYEGHRHRAWFEEKRNKAKFKHRFREDAKARIFGRSAPGAPHSSTDLGLRSGLDG